MKISEVKNKISELIKEKGKVDEPNNINYECSMEAYLNSITYIQFIIAIEDAFEFEVDDEELDIGKFSNLNDVIEYVHNRVEN